MMFLIIDRAHSEREKASDLQSAGLLFRTDKAVFRMHSSGALPVLAITGFHFCYKTDGKPSHFAPTGVPR